MPGGIVSSASQPSSSVSKATAASASCCHVSTQHVAPTTLYRLFGSKDGLVGAYLERESRGFRDWFDAAVEAGGSHPRERLFCHIRRPFRAGAAGELPRMPVPYGIGGVSRCRDRRPPPRRQQQGLGTGAIRRLTQELADEVADADALADRLALVMEGVYGSVAALGTDGPAREARDMVEFLAVPWSAAASPACAPRSPICQPRGRLKTRW
jgi:AcrR family transcriptional regulator